MEVMDYEMEEPRPPQQPPSLRDWGPRCPVMRAQSVNPAAQQPFTHPAAQQPSAFFAPGPSTVPPTSLFAANPPAHMPSPTTFPQHYEFRNSFQDSFDAHRSATIRSSNAPSGLAPAATGPGTFTTMRDGNVEGFGQTAPSMPMHHPGTTLSPFHRPSVFPSGLTSPARLNHGQESIFRPAEVAMRLGLTPHVPPAMHSAGLGAHQMGTMGTMGNTNNAAPRSLPPPTDPNRYRLGHVLPPATTTSIATSTTAQTSQFPVPTVSQAPSATPHHLPAVFPSSNLAPTTHLPAPNPSWQLRGSHRWEGPSRIPTNTPPTAAAAAAAMPSRSNAQAMPAQPSRPSSASDRPTGGYHPTSYAGILNGPNPRLLLEANMTQSLEPNAAGSLSNPTGSSGPVSAAGPNHQRMEELYRYISSGGLDQRVRASYENNNLTEPGRPLQDFNDYLSRGRTNGTGTSGGPGGPSGLRGAGVGPSEGGSRDRRPDVSYLDGYWTGATTTARRLAASTTAILESAERDIDLSQLRARRDWQYMVTREIREREAELAILLERTREGRDGFSSRRATARAIQGLKAVEISSLDEEDRSCSICMERFGVREPTEGKIEHPVKLPCGHVFGLTCIKTWLSDHCTCPSCRRRVESEIIKPPCLPSSSAAAGTTTTTTTTSTSRGATTTTTSTAAPTTSTTAAQRASRAPENSNADPSTVGGGRPSRRRRTTELNRFGTIRPRLAGREPPATPTRTDMTTMAAGRMPDRLRRLHTAEGGEGLGDRPNRYSSQLGPSSLSRRWDPTPGPLSTVGQASTSTNIARPSPGSGNADMMTATMADSPGSSSAMFPVPWSVHPAEGANTTTSLASAPAISFTTTESSSRRGPRRPVRSRTGRHGSPISSGRPSLASLVSNPTDEAFETSGLFGNGNNARVAMGERLAAADGMTMTTISDDEFGVE